MLGFIGLVFATMVLAAPLAPLYSTHGAMLHEPSNSTSTHFVRRLNPNACPANKNHFPEVSQWERGMNQFCDNHGDPMIYGDKPVTVTLTLTGHDGLPIDWVFRISLDNGNAPPTGAFPGESVFAWSYDLSAKRCKEKFMGFTKDKGGGMREVYCEWNSDKGDIRDIVMLGGKYDGRIQRGFWATVIWETRAKKGQPGVDQGW